jgi:hypothetical protein
MVGRLLPSTLPLSGPNAVMLCAFIRRHRSFEEVRDGGPVQSALLRGQ